MNARRVAFLSLFLVLFTPSQLQQVCPPPGRRFRCSNQASTGDWQSNVFSMRGERDAGSPRATQLVSWSSDPNLPAGLDYIVVTRNMNVSGSPRMMSMPTNNTDQFPLSLPYDTRFELLVCYSNVSGNMLRVNGNPLPFLVPECGLCSSCFRTDKQVTLNVTDAAMLDNGSGNLEFRCEASGDPANITFIWEAMRTEDNVIVQLSDTDVEIMTTQEDSSTLSSLTLERGGDYRRPSCTATNGLLNETRGFMEFRQVSLIITKATVQEFVDEDETVYRCTVTRSPRGSTDFKWEALTDEDSSTPVTLTSNMPNIEIDKSSNGMEVTSTLTVEERAEFFTPRCIASFGGFSVSKSSDDFDILQDFTEPLQATGTSTDMSNASRGNRISISLGTIIALVVVPAVVIPVVAILAVLIYRRIRILKRKKHMRAISIELLQRSIMSQEGAQVNGGTDAQNTLSQPQDMERDLMSASIQKLRDKLPEAMIIDPTELKVTVVIGQGEFGVIYKAHYYQHENQSVVAVKTLKGIFTTAGDIENATKEILKMYKFNHPNVMSLIGVCMAPSNEGSSAGPSMVMPFMAKGSLLDHLRKEANHLKPTSEAELPKIRKELVQICQQIAKGMEYLADLHFIHRDLAARNCLMDAYGIIKVSDFGLTENLYSRNYFKQVNEGAKLPIKWMALESIRLGRFTEKSDVWSYGVTCWEVFTGGSIPYPGLHPRDVLDLLECGDRLHRPKNQACCSSMYSLMLSCWRENEENRPTFSDIVRELEKFLEITGDYLDLSAYNTDQSSSEADIASLPEIEVPKHNLLERVASSPNAYTEAADMTRMDPVPSQSLLERVASSPNAYTEAADMTRMDPVPSQSLLERVASSPVTSNTETADIPRMDPTPSQNLLERVVSAPNDYIEPLV